MKIDVAKLVSKIKATSISLLGEVLPVGLEVELIVAVDIGCQDIKVVQFKRQRRGGDWYLSSSEMIAISSTRGNDKTDKEKNKEIIKALKKVFADKDLKRTKVICVVGDIKGIEKRILTPLISDNELKQAIHWKMKDFINFSLEEACIDFKIIGKVDVEGETKDEIFTVAFSKDTINHYLYLFKEVKVTPSSFVSLSTCIEYNLLKPDTAGDETVAFVDLGTSHTQLIINRGSKFVFSRQLPVTGSSITKAMTTVLETQKGRVTLSFAEAEQIKKECGIPKAGSESIAGKNITCSQVLSLIRPEIEKLASEITHSFDYYYEEFQASSVSRLVLIGRGANLKGVDAFLAQSLGILVELGDPFSQVPSSDYRSQEELNKAVTFFACIGAAKSMINQFKTGTPEINLLPEEIKEQNKLFIKRLTSELIITLFVIMALVIFLGMKFAHSGMIRRLGAIEAQIYSQRYRQKEASLKGIVGQIYAREPRWMEVFREISNVIPKNIYLERLSYDKEELLFEGVIISKIESTEDVLSDFMLSLEKGIFKNVSLIQSKRVKDEKFPRVEFKLKCQVE
ncbi:MAG: pilus assembly protein PilM [Candidatus Omnitrophica bacterium]|nr:pilus assembly protein PilM [Candidatus Omnitrophota bacterium]